MKLKNVFMILASLIFGLILFMPAANGLAQAAPASLRIVQTSPDAPRLDIFINGKKTVSDLSYQSISTYTNLPGGRYDLKIIPSSQAGAGDPVLDVPGIDLNDGSVNTLIVAGLFSDKSLSVLPLSDTSWNANTGTAKVRFIHTSPDAPSIDITVGSLGKVFSNISFKGVGQYMEVPAGSFNLKVNPTNNQNQTVLTKTLNFEAGKVYTVYAVGQLADRSLNTLVSVDNGVVASISSMPSAMPATGQGSSSQAQTGNWQLAWLLMLGSILSLSMFGLSRHYRRP